MNPGASSKVAVKKPEEKKTTLVKKDGEYVETG